MQKKTQREIISSETNTLRNGTKLALKDPKITRGQDRIHVCKLIYSRYRKYAIVPIYHSFNGGMSLVRSKNLRQYRSTRLLPIRGIVLSLVGAWKSSDCILNVTRKDHNKYSLRCRWFQVIVQLVQVSVFLHGSLRLELSSSICGNTYKNQYRGPSKSPERL